MAIPPIRVLELRSVRGTGGGPEKTILLGAAQADPARFEITVCYLRDRRDEVFEIAERARDLGVRYVEIAERHSFDVSIWPRLVDLVRSGRIDIVHAHEYKTDLLAWLLARRTGVVPLATAHGWTGHSRREHWLYYPMDRWLLARLPRVVAVSGQIRDVLVRAGARADHVSVVPNGIDPETFRRDRTVVADVRASFDLASGDIVVGAVGRLEPQKRFDRLIEAIAVVRQTCSRVRLLIAGEGSQRPALLALAEARGLGDAVRLMGHEGDIIRFHHALDLFVQASAYEGTPNAVLEAMALETPVVATDAGGTSEILRDGADGVIVPASVTAQALAEAIRCTLDDTTTMDRRASSARRRVETTLSFRTRMRAVERIYEDLAGIDRPSLKGSSREHS